MGEGQVQSPRMAEVRLTAERQARGAGLEAKLSSRISIFLYHEARGHRSSRTSDQALEMRVFHSPVARKSIGAVFLFTVLSFFPVSGISQEKNRLPAPPAGQESPAVLKVTTQAPAEAPAAPRSIKFHGKNGHEGKLEWSAERIFYSGDMPPQASAGALFNSLFGKGFSCDGGRLVSVTDKTTPAPQPLHFRTDDNHSAEVYLDAPDGVKYSGNLTIDESAKPVFEALRQLFQCKSPQ